MSTAFLHPKRKTYYHRSVVPRRLMPYFKGREQLWRSLKTADKDEATLKSAQWTARIQRLFLTLKKQGDRMTNEQRERLGTERVRLLTGQGALPLDILSIRSAESFRRMGERQDP
jgi:uncharacterized protein DUF6538